MKPSDFKYAVFHQPNGKFPTRASKALGFTSEQVKQGLLVPKLGNTYSGASPLGLTAILDVAEPGDYVFMVSYGSGSGSDGFVFRITDNLPAVQNLAPQTWDQLNNNKTYLDYGTYMKYRGKILKAE